MRCALKSLPIYFSISRLLQISPVLFHNEFCCFMEMTHVGPHQDGGVCLDYLWEGANERWQGYYGGEQLWGRAMFQLSTPGMPRADSDHIMQLKSKVREVSSHAALGLWSIQESLLHILFIVGGIQLGSDIPFYSSALPPLETRCMNWSPL